MCEIQFWRHMSFLTLIGVLLAGANLPGQDKGPSGSDKEEFVSDPLLRAGWEAYQASTAKVQSARGEGIYQEFASDPNAGGEMKLLVEANCTVQFARDKFQIDLRYKQNLIDRIESQVIIYDGNILACSQFSPRILPFKAEADVYHPDGKLYSPSQCGFHFNLPALPAEVLPLDAMRRKQLFPLVQMKKTESGVLTGSVRNGELVHEFDFSPQSGFNTTEWRSYRDGVKYKTVLANWEKKNEIWFVASIVSETEPVDAKGKIHRIVFRYDKFEPNAVVSPDAFKLASLKLPDGARILDRRDGKTEIFRNLKLKQTDQKKIDSLIEQIKQLPSDGISTRDPPASSTLRTVLYIIGGILVILGLWLGWRRRAAKVHS